MSNKDVILQISIAVLFCFFMFPHTLFARGNQRVHDENNLYNSSNNVTYDSYENYLEEKGSNMIKQSVPKQNKNHKKNQRTVLIQKSKQAINTNNTKYIRYTVRKGETLTVIAKKNNIPVSLLRDFNTLNNQNIIKKGMILKIPLKQESSVTLGKSGFLAEHDSRPLAKPQFQWPVKTVVNYRQDGLNGVKSIGIIITGKPGSTVLSSAPGTVKKIGRMRGFGNYIVINHSGRYATVYSNLDMILVSKGDSVTAGNAIGKMNSSEKKIHFQIDLEGKPENPLQYLPKNI